MRFSGRSDGKPALLLSLIALASCSDAAFTKRSLRQHGSPSNAVAVAHHAAAKHSGPRRAKSAIAPEVLDAGFWFGDFDVGLAKNLSLLIDSGSTDVAVDPHLYKPSVHSRDLHEKGQLGYGTVDEDGCGVARINYTTFTDIVSQEGLVSRNQTFAEVIATKPPNKGTITKFPHGGIVGFSGIKPDETQLGGVPFFQSLCNEKAVEECRFGLAFGTSGTGYQILGGVDDDLFKGKLTRTKVDRAYGDEWFVNGSYVVKGSVSKLQPILLDSGTANIVGPPKQVRKIFETLGIQAVEQHLPGCTETLFGYYPCDNPPKLGFSFAGPDDSVFDITPSAWELANDGKNNCTAIVTGIDFPFWILGQAWFQTRYVDMDTTSHSVGVAQLKDETCA